MTALTVPALRTGADSAPPVTADLAVSERLTAQGWRSRSLRQRVEARVVDLVGRPLQGLGAEGLTGRAP